MAKKSLLVLSSPSGGGKTTIARHLLKKHRDMRFSISATTRPPRPREVDGRDYYFLSKEEFEQKIKNNELIEYEEIFGNYYATPKSEVESAMAADEKLIFDVDVKGALSVRKAYPESSLLIFISPPTIEELERRLRGRSTESEPEIQRRISRAKMEMEYSEKFDYIVINENLSDAKEETEYIIAKEMY
ncbi:MAG: guanylate kinase [Candidatus Kapaibacterium sp.]